VMVSVMQLAVPPMAPPAGAKYGAPLIYLEPSGTVFNAPGVNVTLPLTEQLDTKDPTRPGVFRLSQGSWVEIPSSNELTRLDIDRPDDPRFITHTVGTTMTFSAYALVILDKTIFTTQTTASVETTTPPPREKPEDLLNVWWMIFIVYPASGLVGLLVILSACFRCRYGYFPCFKPRKHNLIHSAFAPTKIEGQNALRLKLLEQEEKSKNHYTEEKDLSKMGVLMKESIEAKLRADADLEGPAASTQQKNKKVDPKHGADVSEPPHPISQLVRSGILMPPRSSVVDGANRKMLSESGGAGAPEKLEINDLTVKADFGFGANSSHLLDSDTDGLNIKRLDDAVVTGELVVADENEGEDGGGAGTAGVDQTSKSFTGKLQSSGLYPPTDDDNGETSSPWLLTLHRGLGSMVEEGLGLSNSLRGSVSRDSAEDSSANGHGRKGLSTKRHKIDIGAGPKEAGAGKERDIDDVEVAV